ncbi:cobalamin-independent methionine synthase II family protein [Bosea sp. (in: a-proteobacteria)]|uniref:cobalamin-independent methionine synthase II family protein n=1 Tax=Bosea sp. (in: a-proteobacteria) TaxID=1871050 RepID=UPI00261910FA|nr:cobalamin-independent methionine synthase II family protein [Bosea sp. (in: a-proteobacteria)]MCO5089669.1 cobalamin-independent methionine synthase II family protein [Bosea sp. (in: a-proteobacteria)]
MAAERILTTHTGSLPRHADIVAELVAQAEGRRFDDELFSAVLERVVERIVARQVETGIDIVNDGEAGKVSYATYVAGRLSGFSSAMKPRFTSFPDVVDFPEYAERVLPQFESVLAPVCEGPVSYRGEAAVARDCRILQRAVDLAGAKGAFMSAASPGVIARFMDNHHYASHEDYLWALADAMKVEYDAIHEAGFILQLDCPDLTGNRPIHGTKAGTSYVDLHIEALNHAVRDIPSERMRMHLCWGNYEGPHHKDTPLRQIIASVLKARPAGLSIEAANPRHAHEWNVFLETKLPDWKYLIPGVVDSTSNFIEHPELVAQRLERFASVVGPERVVAGTDCGFGTFTGVSLVDADIAWAKLGSMVEGAALASRALRPQTA